MVLLFNYLLKVLFLLSILLCYLLSPAYSNMMWRSFDQQLEDEPLRGNSSFSYNDDRTMFLLSAQAAQAPTSVQQNGNTSALLPTPKSFDIGTLKVALDKGTSHIMAIRKHFEKCKTMKMICIPKQTLKKVIYLFGGVFLAIYWTLAIIAIVSMFLCCRGKSKINPRIRKAA